MPLETVLQAVPWGLIKTKQKVQVSVQRGTAVAELGWQVERMYAMRRPYPVPARASAATHLKAMN
jgi:hypothetical protein